jgi:DNA polymerase-1
MNSEKKSLYVIDGSSYIHRAFHAVRNLSTSGGFPTNAVFGFLGMLRRVLREKNPSYMAVALDSGGPTFRHRLSPAYKANRARTPEALSVQIPYIKRLIAAYRIPWLEVPDYEADDLIGTLTTWAAGEGAEVIIVSGDKDLLQLVGPGVRLWDTMKDVVMGPEEVQGRYGVPPGQLVEVMGLAGDSSDNIPGVPGIGLKTAQRLISGFGTIDSLLSGLDKVSSEKERARLETYGDQAILSRRLARIDCDVPMDIDWHGLEVGEQDPERLAPLFRELEFKKFLHELQPGAEGMPPVAEERRYELVCTVEELEEVVAGVRGARSLTLAVEASGGGPLRADMVGLSLAWGPEKACYIPLRHTYQGAPEQLQQDTVLLRLRPLLGDRNLAKAGHNIKFCWNLFRKQGLELGGVRHDTMVAAYVLDPGKGGQKLGDLAREYLDEPLFSYRERLLAENKECTFADLPVEHAGECAAGEAAACLRLVGVLENRLDDAGQASLFHEIEMPLIPVLGRMETTGVKVDVARLERLGEEFTERLHGSADRIYTLAGERFNINSPRQLGEILFEKLGLPLGKKTKTGYSTAVDVLSGLAAYHPLPAEVLNYRSLMKLKTGYVDSLPRMVHPETGRIHTSYNQTVTATGRLSSSEPNLQNIPVRTEEGRQIRRTFAAESGCKILSADYSQIELRILAHYSRDERLRQAFTDGEDIHRGTAADIFQVDGSRVTAEMRRQAKTINFGIIYGISAFGLSRELGIPQGSARDMIKRYFDRYEGVLRYVEEMPEVARKQGFVSTLFNRRRFLPDLHSRNSATRKFAERTAINTPIQGSAADIIKMSMIRIDTLLERRRLPARMIMQVHDELVFEVEAGAVKEVAAMVQHEMESVARLDVPLVVDMGVGDNWGEAH